MKTLSPRPGVLAGYLGRVPVLQDLDAARLDSMADRATLRLYDRGETLFTQGEPGHCLFWVAHGAVRVFRTLPRGRDKVIHLLPAPTLVAEVPTLLGQPFPASADCTEPSTVVVVQRAALLSAVAEDPEVSLRLLAGAMARLQELTRTVAQQGHLSAVQRVAAYLAGLAGEDPEVVLPAAKKDVASYLGLTPESFSRALASLKERGAIATDEGGVAVRDLAALERVLHG